MPKPWTTTTEPASSWNKTKSYRNFDEDDPYIPPGSGLGTGLTLFGIGVLDRMSEQQDLIESLKIYQQPCPADATRIAPVNIPNRPGGN
jgi:hypothetical protein